MKKLTVLFFVMTFAVGKSFSQSNRTTDYLEFGGSLAQKIFHTGTRWRDCKPTVCLIRIDVDKDRNVLNIQFSDSADSVVRARVNEIKKSINFTDFKKFLSSERADDGAGTYFIPLYHSVRYGDGCLIQTVGTEKMLQFSSFSGVFVTGKIIMLDPIYWAGQIIH